jgi:hypothetical protein
VFAANASAYIVYGVVTVGSYTRPHAKIWIRDNTGGSTGSTYSDSAGYYQFTGLVWNHYYQMYAKDCLPGDWGTYGQLYQSSNYTWNYWPSSDKNVNITMYYTGYYTYCTF